MRYVNCANLRKIIGQSSLQNIVHTISPAANCTFISLLIKGFMYIWYGKVNVHKLGGRLRYSKSLSSCKYDCMMDTRCEGIDWNRFRKQCYAHDAWTIGSQLLLNYEVQHYIIRRFSVNGTVTIAYRVAPASGLAGNRTFGYLLSQSERNYLNTI